MKEFRWLAKRRERALSTFTKARADLGSVHKETVSQIDAARREVERHKQRVAHLSNEAVETYNVMVNIDRILGREVKA